MTSGTISLLRQLDYESVSNYSMEVVASNKCDEEEFDKVPLFDDQWLNFTVEVGDVNDNPPYFVPNDTFGGMVADSGDGTKFSLGVDVRDVDTNSVLTCDFASPVSLGGNHQGMDDINLEDAFIVDEGSTSGTFSFITLFPDINLPPCFQSQLTAVAL